MKSPPPRRHANSADHLRIAPWLVWTADGVVLTAAAVALLHTWASGWDTARADDSTAPVVTAERSTYTPRDVPELRVPSAANHTEVIPTTTQMPIAADSAYPGTPESPWTATSSTGITSQTESTTVMNTSTAPLTSTNAPTTSISPTTTAPTTTTAGSTTASTTTTAPTTEPTETTEVDVTLPTEIEVEP